MNLVVNVLARRRRSRTTTVKVTEPARTQHFKVPVQKTEVRSQQKKSGLESSSSHREYRRQRYKKMRS